MGYEAANTLLNMISCCEADNSRTGCISDGRTQVYAPTLVCHDSTGAVRK
jgi:hypothetical protein